MTVSAIRFRDESWQVLHTEGARQSWVTVDSEQDAQLLAASSDLIFEAIEGREGEELAQELDRSADLLERYKLLTDASLLREGAKLTRNLPCKLDDVFLD